MNLSTAIYLTEFIGNLAIILNTLFIVGMLIFLFVSVAYFLCLDKNMDYDNVYKTAYLKIIKNIGF
jgi:hypothetical protein